MTTRKWTIQNKTFSTESEYKAGIADQEKIKLIKKNYDLNDVESVIDLYKAIQLGHYSFESIIGREFDDEIFELVERLKKTNQLHSYKSSTKSDIRKLNKTKLNKTKSTQDSYSLKDCDEKLQKEIINQIKLREKRRKSIILGLSILSVACIGYFSFYYYMDYKKESEMNQLSSMIKENNSSNSSEKTIIVNKTSDELIIPDVLEKYEMLHKKNKSLIGWIKIDDTKINYPVMQSSNPEYYLDHNANQEYDKNGSIFLDPACDIVNRNDNMIIYGHHMKSGKMFGDLDLYQSKNYYEKHPIISFDTIYEEGTYQVMYVFRSKIYNENEIVFKYYQFFDVNSKEEFNSHMTEMEKLSLYDTGVKASYGDELLTLSTCDYQEPNGRFVVVAKRLK